MLKNSGPLGLHPQKPLVDDAPAVDLNNIKLATPPNYKLGEQVATRLAYGTALAKVRIFFFSVIRAQYILLSLVSYVFCYVLI